MRFALFLVAAAALQASMEVNPIRRIVTLLQNMQKEVKAEGEKEQELFVKFQCYCSKQQEDLDGDVAGNAADQKQKEAEIESKSARKSQLDAEVTAHKVDREEAEGAIEKATSMRKKENDDYVDAAGEKKSYVDGLNKAIPAIEKGMGGASLMQIPAGKDLSKAVSITNAISEEDRNAVSAFLQGPYGDYSGASGEIVGILKTMLDDFKKDLGGIVETEESALATFNQLIAAKNKEIKAAGAAIEKKSVRAGELAVEVTKARNAAENAKREAGANAEFLANLNKDCANKAKEMDVRTATRNEELIAISEAIKVLNDDDALDIFKKTLPSPSAPSFLQGMQNSRRARRAQAYALINNVAGASKDRNMQLSLLATLIRAGKVDFNKVLKMVDDMVAHLKQEQKDDNTQLDYCRNEFEESDDRKKDLKRKLEDATAEIDELSQTSETLAEDIESLTNKIKELDDAVAQATEQRKAENAEYQQTNVELGAAAQLLEKAKNKLNKFYNPGAYKPPPQRELTEEERIAQSMGEVIPTDAPKMIPGTNIPAFLQLADKPDAPPATFEGGHKKNAKSGGVIALMDMMIKDVDTQIQEGEHDEKTAQKDYEGLMADSTETRATDSKSVADKKNTKAETEGRLVEAKKIRGQRHTEMEETNKYISSLHGSCDFLLDNHAFRKEARAKESDALKNAKAVLNGANFA